MSLNDSGRFRGISGVSKEVSGKLKRLSEEFHKSFKAFQDVSVDFMRFQGIPGDFTSLPPPAHGLALGYMRRYRQFLQCIRGVLKHFQQE